MGTLFVVATPIGNLDDLSVRAVRILREASLIAAEDTRHSRKLLAHFGIDTPMISYHEHNQRERRDLLLRSLEAGDVALITDAGTPAISDPGVDLVAAAHAAGHAVSPVPGPSSLAAAVSASGLVDGPFLSLGFLPRERGPRQTAIGRAAASGLPFVLFESPHRLADTLADLEDALGDRDAVVARELTKLHEEVRPGRLRSLRSWAEGAPPRGEIALVVAGAGDERAAPDDAASVVAALRRSGLSPSQAAREAATITGLPRSELYAMARSIAVASSAGLEGELSVADEHTLEQPLRDEERPER